MTHRAPSVPACLAVTVLLLSACGDRTRVEVDLLAAYPNAQVRQETTAIDLGTEAARSFLRKGWSMDEGDPGESTYVWALGRESTLGFTALGDNDLKLVLRGWPLDYPGAGAQTVEIEVDGTKLGAAELPKGGGTLRFDLPASVLQDGENELLLRAAYSAVPAEALGTEDRRDVSVAWDSILIQGPSPRDQAAVEARPEDLVLAYGTEVSYYLWLPGGAELVIDRLAGDGGEAGVLAVTAARDRQPPVTAKLGAARGGHRVPLGDEAGVLRLSLAAIARGEEDLAPLVLRRPRIEAPAEAAPPEPAGTAVAETSAARPNIVIYLVDTLRADRLGCYGGTRGLSPAIDAFAEQAVLFEHAVAQAPWTRPSVASLFTGLSPDTHGVQDRGHHLPEEPVTLAEVLRGEGYETAGFLTNPNAAGRFGLGQGFDTYKLLPRRAGRRSVNELVDHWLSERPASERPFLLYLHTAEPHGPYAPPENLRQKFAPEVEEPELRTLHFLRLLARGEVESGPELAAKLSALYDAEVAHSDARFGELLEILRRHRVDASTVVVFVSDHGEEFLEHGRWQHGHSLYTELLDVPLIVRFPGVGEGLRFSDPVQHVDLFPTLLAYLGVPAPPALEGRNLLPAIRGTRAAASEPWRVISTIGIDEFYGHSVTTPRYRFILPQSRKMGSGVELYDRISDPGEKDNIAAELPILSEYFRILLASRVSTGEPAPTVEEEDLDPEIREQLRALGYLE